MKGPNERRSSLTKLRCHNLFRYGMAHRMRTDVALPTGPRTQFVLAKGTLNKMAAVNQSRDCCANGSLRKADFRSNG